MDVFIRAIKVIIILSLAIGLSGCALLNQPRPDDPAFAPVPPHRMKAPAENNGAIYQAGFSRNLFEDRRATRVGDMLTVVLAEKTDSQKKANTSIKKDNESTVTNPTILGSTLQFKAPGIVPLASNTNAGLNASLNAEREFTGEADSQQNNKLSGTITVTVADVLPNGNLIIRGEKWIKLNQGEEYIRLSGIVRPEDITSNNTVVSTQIADARIAYSGTGELSSANVMGWLAKFFTSALFPF